MKIFILFKQIAKQEINEEIYLTPYYDEVSKKLKNSYVLEASVKKECINVFCDFLEAKQAVYKNILQSHFIDKNIENKWHNFFNDPEEKIIHYIYNKEAIRYEITEKEIINNKITGESK